MLRSLWKLYISSLLMGFSHLGAIAHDLVVLPLGDVPEVGVVLRVDFNRFDISIAATSRINGFSSQAPTLESFVFMATRNKSSLANFAVLSGGFSSYDPMEPAGLLVENGRLLSPLASKTKTLSGVLCIGRQGTGKILYTDDYLDSERDCQWAIQGGPLVVEPGREAISRTAREKSMYRRLVACELHDPNLFEFYMFERADLRYVEDTLKTRCRIALNLTGDVQAGMLVSNARGERLVFGSAKSPLASIIFIKSRDSRNPIPVR